jgi:hypothetical protein
VYGYDNPQGCGEDETEQITGSKGMRYYCDKKERGVMIAKANKVCLIRRCPHLKVKLMHKPRRR